jgi:integrase
MVRTQNRLTAMECKNAKSSARLADGGGLYLYVSGKGTKSWVFRFNWHGKRKEMGLGSFLTLGLAEAREAAENARKRVANDENPIAERSKAWAKSRQTEAQAQSFGEFADGYVERLGRKRKTVSNWKRTVTVYAAAIRRKRFDEIGSDEIINFIEPLMVRVPVAATKALNYLEKIFDAARVAGLLNGENPARWRGHLEHRIEKRKPLSSRGHHLALPYAELPAFMVKLRQAKGTAARALDLTILTAMRTNEAIGALWEEIDLGAKVWSVPGTRMKAGRAHRVALSADAVALLMKLQRSKLPESSKFIFPGQNKGNHLGSMAMTRVLKRLGVKDRSTVHGFRSTFRDWIGEKTDFPSELAEIALAHKPASVVEAAYSRGDALEKRFPMMDEWADYCADRETATQQT